MPQRPLTILILCDDARAHAGTLREHLAAFRRYSRHRIELFNTRGVWDSRYPDFAAADVLVLHYSLVITADSYLSPPFRDRVRAFAGLKVQFLQDEYRWVDEISGMMRHLDIDVLFSIVPPRELENVYGGRLPGVEIVPTLAGYVPEQLVDRKTPALHARALDVGYRGRVLPYWNGALSQEKVSIARGFLDRARATDLRTDIAWGENDRLYGSRWIRFLSSCRTTLGTESGTSITDFDGSIEAATRDYLDGRPGASFEEVSEQVLAPHEGNVMMNVVSPRLFEAAALRTAMVLFPGEYGGTVEPWEHYVPLEKEFGNFDQVVEAIRDVKALEEMVERAHADVVASGRYSLRRFVEQFDEEVAQRAEPSPRRSTHGFFLARVERPLRTGSVWGYNPRSYAGRMDGAVAAGRAVTGDPALRRLAGVWARSRGSDSRIRAARLSDDLLRLGVLRLAHAEPPGTLDRFYVRWRWDEEQQTLVFVSTPPSATAQESIDSAVIPWSQVRVILWDHREIGVVAHWRRTPRTWHTFGVGYYGMTGIHHLGALGDLLRIDEAAVVEALTPLLRPPAWLEDPECADEEPRPPARWVSVALHPRNYLAKGLLLARLVVRKPHLRRLLVAYRNDPKLRGAVGARELLEDLVKLHAVEEVQAGRLRGIGVDIVREGDSLRFVTRPSPNASQNRPRPSQEPLPDALVWDNRLIGPRLRFPTRVSPRLEIAAGPEGVHEFVALDAVGRLRPELLATAIRAQGEPARDPAGHSGGT